MLTNFAVRFSIWRICNCQTSWLQETDKIVRTGVRLLEWDSVTHCIKIKRPAHLSIVERLGGFWWCKGTALIWNNQTVLKKKNKVSLRNRHFTLKCHKGQRNRYVGSQGRVNVPVLCPPDFFCARFYNFAVENNFCQWICPCGHQFATAE